MKNKQNILEKKKKKNCLNTVQLSSYPPNKTIFLGTHSVGAKFVGTDLAGGPSW